MSEDYNILIRPEQSSDWIAIRSLVQEAFAVAEHSDGDEHNLIERIRFTEDYIPQLSLVAEVDGIVVGYVMFSRIYIGNREAVALAPVSVSVCWQSKGIGVKLITTGHRIASQMGYPCSVVLGNPDYYKRFGYKKAADYMILPPFDVPDSCYMAIPLSSAILPPSGKVRYSKAFDSQSN